MDQYKFDTKNASECITQGTCDVEGTMWWKPVIDVGVQGCDILFICLYYLYCASLCQINVYGYYIPFLPIWGCPLFLDGTF